MMRLLRAPTLHMVLLGLLLFAADSFIGAPGGREELVVPRHRLERSLQVLAEDLRRSPSAAEKGTHVGVTAGGGNEPPCASGQLSVPFPLSKYSTATSAKPTRAAAGRAQRI